MTERSALISACRGPSRQLCCSVPICPEDIGNFAMPWLNHSETRIPIPSHDVIKSIITSCQSNAGVTRISMKNDMTWITDST